MTTYSDREGSFSSFRSATPAQLAALKVMIAERDVSAIAAQVDAARDAAIHGRFSIADASHLFTLVKAQPRVGGGEITPGVYRAATGTLYRVYPARADRSRMLAKEVVLEDGTPELVYAGAASRFVRADQRLSLEEVKALGIQGGQTEGWCVVCGTELTDPDSIDAGIGPVCARNYA